MKVIALKTGYVGRLIQAGDVFEVPDGATASWFVPVQQVSAQADEAVQQQTDTAAQQEGADAAPRSRKKAPADKSVT